MIIDRRTFITQKGHASDAVAVIEEMGRLLVSKFGDRTYRIYLSSIAPFDMVACEIEHESLAEFERVNDDFFAMTEVAPLMEKWNEVTQTGGTHEIWNLQT